MTCRCLTTPTTPHCLHTHTQVPSWLDTSNPRVTVVPHSTIFRNASHLPSFNSNAIQANLLNIPGRWRGDGSCAGCLVGDVNQQPVPQLHRDARHSPRHCLTHLYLLPPPFLNTPVGLSPHFVMMDDDLFLTAPWTLSDFLAPDGGQVTTGVCSGVSVGVRATLYSGWLSAELQAPLSALHCTSTQCTQSVTELPSVPPTPPLHINTQTTHNNRQRAGHPHEWQAADVHAGHTAAQHHLPGPLWQLEALPARTHTPLPGGAVAQEAAAAAAGPL